MKKIEEIRSWIDMCERNGMFLPDEIHSLDAYARLLEATILSLQAKLLHLEVASIK